MAIEQAGMKPSDLARKLEKHWHQVHRWIDKGTVPEADTLAKIAEATGVSLDWLMRGESRVERDDELGYSEVEAYCADMEKAGTPVAPEHAAELREWKRKHGNPQRELVIGYHRGLVAADAKKALERPIIEAKIDEARGQRMLPPSPPKKRRR